MYLIVVGLRLAMFLLDRNENRFFVTIKCVDIIM